MTWFYDLDRIIYFYTIPRQKSALKIGLLFDLVPQASDGTNITEDLSLRRQKTFFVEKESENCVSTEV